MKIHSLIVMVMLFSGPVYASNDEIYQPIEASALVRDSALATRRGDSLFLKLGNGKILTLQNSKTCEQADNCWTYYYGGVFAHDQFYVIHLGSWEGRDTSLIARQSGKIVWVNAEPHLSPDEKWIFSTTGMDYYSKSGIYLWEVRNGKLIKRFAYEPTEQKHYLFKRWLSKDTVLLQEYAYDDSHCSGDFSYRVTQATLRLQADHWYLQPVPGKTRCEEVF